MNSIGLNEGRSAPPPSKGVRRLTLADQLPNCRIVINRKLYDLESVCLNADVVDIGCGFGRNRPLVEGVGGTWVGVEPFEGGGHTVLADADDLPFSDGAFDVAIMDAVLEHLPNVEASFSEVARVLRKGGVFIGYVAFMGCFHEISYFHVSFKALEHLAQKNGLVLEAVSGGGRFGIDYHTAVLLYPVRFGWGRALIAGVIRSIIRLKSFVAYVVRRILKRDNKDTAWEWATKYYQLECLRQSNGFSYIIRKPKWE
jgi:SAM-dependent methyltransferase